MPPFLKALFSARNIRKRILVRGFALTVVPLSLVMAVVWIANGQANSLAAQGCYRLANQDLNRVVLALLSACVQHEEHISSSLAGARVVLNHAGQVHFDRSQNVAWQAKDQFTNKVTPITLPLMWVGATALRQVSDFSKSAPIVDDIQQLYGTSATVFQRMNPAGDMLRVSTTIKKADGARAIGTFIPSVGADGKPNPVLRKVLKGESYHGRAFVVNSWYMAAYEPMKDEAGNVVGMIYTGLPEVQVRDSLIHFKDRLAVGGNTDIFVVHTSAKAQGLFVVSNNPALQDHQAWDVRDAKNQLFVQDICNRAVKLKGAEISEASFWTLPTDKAASRKMLVRFVYFPAWDWVIGVQEPEEEFMALALGIGHVFLLSNFLPLGVVILAALGSIWMWNRLTGKLTAQVEGVMQTLEKSSHQFGEALKTITHHADSVGTAAEQLFLSTQVQARSAEETSASTSSVSQTALDNSKAAARMRSLSAASNQIMQGAKETLGDVNAAMQAILDTNDRALTIIDTINEISFATNIVSLNASIEAARAGEAGRTFAFIAEEVRQLSSRVAAAAAETKAVIGSSRAETDRGTRFVSKLITALEPLEQNADQVRGLAVDLSAASEGQAESMRHLLQAMEEIEQASEQTAKSAQRGTIDSCELRAQVSALAASVNAVDQAVQTLHQEFFSTH